MLQQFEHFVSSPSKWAQPLPWGIRCPQCCD